MYSCYLLLFHTGVNLQAHREATCVGQLDWSCIPCSERADPYADAVAEVPDVADAAHDVADPAPDVSLYATDLGEFVEPDSHAEGDMDDNQPEPRPVAAAEGPVTYTEVLSSSIRGRPTLVDSVGYSYTWKVDKRRTDITWRCSAQNKELSGKATVQERFGEYHHGRQPHICNVAPGRATVAETRDCRRDSS